MYLKIQQKTSLPWLHLKTDQALRRDENSVKFLEGRFLEEKVPFLHKKKNVHSFELPCITWFLQYRHQVNLIGFFITVFAAFRR